jgi:hypothetical protein
MATAVESKPEQISQAPEFGVTYEIAYEAAKTLIDAVNKWHATDVAPVPFGNGTDIPITQALDQAIRYSCDAVADLGKTVDPRAYARLLAFDTVCAEYRKFLNRAAQEDPFLPPSGTAEFWRAYEWLVKAHEVVRLPKPPSVKDLRDNQKVSEQQIALIYGWVDEDGYPETDKVLDEYEKPGKHSGKGWVHPATTRRLKADAEQWAQRNGARGPVFTSKPVEDAARSKPPSLDEMVRLGCPPKQISNVHGITEAEAMELLQAHKEMIEAAK